jgi:hypothetical protein
MVQPRPAGTTGERSHRKIHSSPQTTCGDSARGAQVLRPMLRQRGKRSRDPVAIRPAGETIMRVVGSSCRSRSTRLGGHQGRGMQASASGMAAPCGPSDQGQPRGAQHLVAEDLRIVGTRHAILDATRGGLIAATPIVTAARIDVSRVGTRQVRRLPTGQPRNAHAQGFLTVSFS